ncbi:MAG: hypothetical protein ACQETE_07840 [Bacteroidota bacterium]
MSYEKRSDPSRHFAETPFGIVSTSRNWYHITRERIEEYVPGLLKKHSLEDLILDAEAWVKSPDSTSLILYLILVLLMPGWLAALVSLAWFGFWYQYKSAFVQPILTRVLKLINSDGVMMIGALVVLSYLGINDRYVDAILGFVLYLLFKVGVLRLGWEYLLARTSPPDIPTNDRVLKMLMMRLGYKFGLEVPEMEQMENQIIDLINKQKSGS